MIRRVDTRQIVEVDGLILEPLLVRSLRGNGRFELLVGDDAALLEIDEEHSAWLQSTLGFDIFGSDVHDADFARHDDAVVVSHVVAAGAKSVTIQNRADVTPVGERDRSRAVPRLLQSGVVFVKRPLVFGHAVVILPRLGNHHHDRFLQRPAAVVKHLQSVIEVARVRAFRLDDRTQLAKISAPQFTFHHALPSEHPV